MSFQGTQPAQMETVYDDSPPMPDPDLLEVEREEDLFLLRIFLWMAVALLFSAGGADWSSSLFSRMRELQGPSSLLLLALMGLACLVMKKVAAMPAYIAIASLLGFAVLNGASFELVFRNISGESFLAVYFSSAAFFLLKWAYGRNSSRSPAAWSAMAITMTGGLAISYEVNSSMHSSTVLQMTSAIVILLFCVLFEYHLQFLRDLKFEFDDAAPEQKAAAVGALLLYLDFVIIFVTVLRTPWSELNSEEPDKSI